MSKKLTNYKITALGIAAIAVLSVSCAPPKAPAARSGGHNMPASSAAARNSGQVTPMPAPAPAPTPAPAAPIPAPTPAVQNIAAARSNTMDLDGAIRAASEDMNGVLPQGTKVALLNFKSGSEVFSEYVIEEMSIHLVRGRKLTVVDRREIDLIRNEMKFQLSGEVSDESAQQIGKLLGAQYIVSGSIVHMGDGYRFRTKVINVNSAAIEAAKSIDVADSPRIKHLLAQQNEPRPAPAPRPASPAPAAAAPQAAPATAATAEPAPSAPVTPSIDGIDVPGANLTEKLAWLQRSAESHNAYIIKMNANDNIAPHTLQYKNATNVTVLLIGVGANRTIRLRSNGTMFTVDTSVTFVLDNNITLQGNNHNNSSLVLVRGGTFVMNNGSAVSGNSGGGVAVVPRDHRGATFIMNGGAISSNMASNGSGVYVDNSNASFEFRGGTISGNTASENGGGVYVAGDGRFTMAGGTISGNTASNGGGVCMFFAHRGIPTFTISSGTITGNTARKNGGGVVILGRHINFTKGGGIITGYDSDPNNGNAVRDEAGNVLTNRGHAIFVSADIRKESTAGSGVNLTYNPSGHTGAWGR